MLRTLALAVALFAFAGASVADCGTGHDTKTMLTPDQQANASQAPAPVKAALPATKKTGDTKSAKTQNAKTPVGDKAAVDKVAANKERD